MKPSLLSILLFLSLLYPGYILSKSLKNLLYFNASIIAVSLLMPSINYEKYILGFSITDLVFLITYPSLIVDFVRSNRNSLKFYEIVYVIYLILVTIVLFIGAASYGLASALAEYRTPFYFITMLILVSRTDLRTYQIVRIVKYFTLIFVGVLISRMAAIYFFGFSDSTWSSNETSIFPRVLNGSIAFSALLLCIISYSIKFKHNKIFTALLCLMIVISQQKTVIVCMIVVFAIMLFMRLNNQAYKALVIFLTSMLIIAANGIFIDDGFTIIDSRNIYTLSWREEGWKVLISDAVYDKRMLFGYGYGHGWERYLSSLDTVVYDAPHNYYVESFLRGGIFSCIIFLLTIISPLFRSQSYILLYSFIAAQFIYFYTYSPNASIGLIYGFAIILSKKWGKE